MSMSKNCFAGRILIRPEPVGGMDWMTPCRIPPEDELPTVPPMYFCRAHYTVVFEELYETLDKAGLIDHALVAAPPDEFDELVQRLRQS